MSSSRFVPEFPVSPGEFYFTVDCPETKKPLLFERDESRGRRPYRAGTLIVSCHHCQTIHQLQNPVVLSREVRKKE